MAKTRSRARSHQTIGIVLASGLAAYLSVIESGGEQLFGVLLRESGVSCPVCGTADCARPHAWRYRKRVRDLSTGEVFERVPIRRAKFCDASTVSLIPGELWRGRSTIGSVLETVVHVLREGIEQAHEWTLYAGTGAPVVSRRTLWRWADLVRSRLVGSAWAWLGPRLGLSWSDQADAAEQLDKLLDHLAGTVLLAFRCATGHAVLDKPTAVAELASCTTRRVAGRLSPSLPQDLSSSLRPRGSWLPRNRRRAPPPGQHGGSKDD
jgi:hypothetical protein